MQTKSVRIQAVLYKNALKDLMKSIESFIIAAKKTNIQIEFAYGDASPEPCDKVKTLESYCTGFGTHFEYIFFNENTGYGRGHNLLAKDAKTDFLLVTNPDILVTSTFFDEILKPTRNDNIGIVEARQTPLEHPKYYDPISHETSWCSGACSLFRTEIYKKVEGFDSETFWMYCEDVDISWRVKLLGYKLIYQPTAVAFHPKRLTANGEWKPTETEKFHSAKSALLMAYKWSNKKVLKKLKSIYRKGNDKYQLEALNDFEYCEQHGNLPKQIESNEHIATFTKDLDYSTKRW